MDPIKVLIVERDILVRRAISNILQQHDVFDVCWLGDDIQNLHGNVRSYDPDVILLGINDMESDGLSKLSSLRFKFPKLPVIAITPKSDKGAEAAISALRIGAVDFVTKPAHKNLILFAERHLKKRLAPIIKAAKQMQPKLELKDEFLETTGNHQPTLGRIEPEPRQEVPAEIVVIGGCTGGVQALFSIVESLPDTLAIPIVVVQHLPRYYTTYLAQKLDAVSSLTVREGKNGKVLNEADIWIAPGGYQCELVRSGHQIILQTHRGLRENTMRPSIDILFRSAAQIYGNRTLGILLSGCGYDGLSGSEEIVKATGRLLAQNPKTAIAADLPLAAIKKRLTKEYYSPQVLASQIVELAKVEKDKHPPEDIDDPKVIGNSFLF